MKKILSLVLASLMLISVLAVGTGAAQYNPEVLDEENLSLTQNIIRDKTFSLGDLDGNGDVNAIDSLFIKSSMTGSADIDINEEAADFDADGAITAKDSYFIKTCLSGKAKAEQYENGKQLYSLTIGGVSITEFSLVIPEDAEYDSNLYFATELLREYIEDATGNTLPVVRGAAEGGHGICLYTVSDDSELGQELGHEGYKYDVTDGSLHIYGTHRGLMYAAYEIIEEYIGYSFFERDHTFLYKQRTSDIPEGTSVSRVPTYRFRHTKSTFPGTNRESGYLARRLNGSQSYCYKNEKRSLEYYGDFVGPVFNNIHSYAYYWQMGTGTMPDDDGVTELEARYYAKYQSGEYKDETKWEPCATDETIYQTLFSGFLDTIRMIEARGYPIKYEDGTNCYSFSLNDNSNWCSCRKCKALIREKTGTGAYLELANRGARDIQKYYPGLKVFTWTYTRETPTNVLPDENLVIVLSGFNCANHHLGASDEDTCEDFSFFGFPNRTFEERIDFWDDLCEQTGAEIWFWYYPETHFYWLYDFPNVYTIFHDIKWLSEHGITGFFYEGSGGRGYLFEHMKAYLASAVMFDTDMTLEEYDELIKKYLYEAYGRGWENIYKLLEIYEEAGNQSGHENAGDTDYCFIGNYDRAYDAVSVTYINENYETMRNLILAAIDEYDAKDAKNADVQLQKLNNLFYCFEILGLGATYLDDYVNGSEDSRAEYTRRYADFLNYYHSTGMTVCGTAEVNAKVPTSVDLEVGNPSYYFFPGGSWRLSVTQLLGNDPTT